MSAMVTLEIVCRERGIEQRVVRQWIERDWLRPDPVAPDGWAFREIDRARLDLLVQLHAMEFGAGGVPVVLSLLDQLYDARRSLSRVRAVLRLAPEETRRALLAELADRATDGDVTEGDGMERGGR